MKFFIALIMLAWVIPVNATPYLVLTAEVDEYVPSSFEYAEKLREVLTDPRNSHLYKVSCAGKTAFDCVAPDDYFFYQDQKIQIGQHPGISYALVNYLEGSVAMPPIVHVPTKEQDLRARASQLNWPSVSLDFDLENYIPANSGSLDQLVAASNQLGQFSAEATNASEAKSEDQVNLGGSWLKLQQRIAEVELKSLPWNPIATLLLTLSLVGVTPYFFLHLLPRMREKYYAMNYSVTLIRLRLARRDNRDRLVTVDVVNNLKDYSEPTIKCYGTVDEVDPRLAIRAALYMPPRDLSLLQARLAEECQTYIFPGDGQVLPADLVVKVGR